MLNLKNKLTIIVIVLATLLSGCGQIVEQDKIVLILEGIGNRDKTVTNNEEAVSDNTGSSKKYKSSLVTATRLPFNTVGMKIFIFSRGIENYRFTKGENIDSKKNEEFCTEVVDGRVCGDFSIQVYIDESLPNIKERLIKFVSRYKLYSYSGQPKVLGKFISSSRFRPIIKNILITYSSNKKILELVRNKTGLNEAVLNDLNDRFNRYGLMFTKGTGLISDIRLNKAQQDNLNKIVVNDVKTEASKLYNEKVRPLDKKIAGYENEGNLRSAEIIATAKSKAMEAKTKAQTIRRSLIIAQIDKKNYSQFEQINTLITSLIGENNTPGKTQIRMIPSDAKLVLQSHNTFTNDETK